MGGPWGTMGDHGGPGSLDGSVILVETQPFSDGFRWNILKQQDQTLANDGYPAALLMVIIGNPESYEIVN